jgi:nucleoside-diphosphate-sugar epimerase
MRVLVTGGRGLLGSAVVSELGRRHDVLAFQRHASQSGAREVLGDIRDSKSVQAAMDGAEAVVHLAAKVSMHGDRREFESINVQGTATVIEAAQRSGVARFVHISSPSVAHAGAPIIGAGAEPADPSSARGAYARSKAAAELIALAADDARMSVVAIRPHLVWGPGDTQLVDRIVARARAGRLFLLDDGAALIDTTYVDNAAEAIAQALEVCGEPDVHGRAFVVSNGEPRTVAELLGRMADAAGAPGPLRSVPSGAAIAAGHVIEAGWRVAGRTDEPALTAFIAEQLSTAHWFDQRQTMDALRWHPSVSLEEGFTRLRAWYASAG